MKQLVRWSWLLLLVPVVAGLARLRFDAEVLNLLPNNLPEVRGLKLYQQHFANARELIVTITATNSEAVEAAATIIASRLHAESNLVSSVVWQPPWLEHPEQMPELIAHLWLNQPPHVLDQLAARLAETNLASVLTATRDRLATTLSPTDIAQLSYDPFGLTHLPENIASAAPGFAEGRQLFASADGKFRIIFVKARAELPGYRECTDWFAAVKSTVRAALKEQHNKSVSIGYTGRPAFVAEISGSMKRDITLSVGGTAVIIAILFWLAHRRLKPMLWLLTLLALILGGTLALGGLIFGTISVVSMGFAAILLGLAVDYAVVHYQEALSHPDLSVPQIRRAIAPSIFWAAVTTIAAFLVLNFGGLPGLAQLGSLVGVGVALSALVMIFAFLPPLFPNRLVTQTVHASHSHRQPKAEPPDPLLLKYVPALSVVLVLFYVLTLVTGLPGMDTTTNALRPRDSQAYATLDAIKANLNQNREPLCVLVAGRDESEVAQRLDAIELVLNRAVANGTLTEFTTPTMLWPRPELQSANRSMVDQLVARREAMRRTALAAGFSEDALALTDNILNTWQRAASSTSVFWPTNEVCSWILGKLVVRVPHQLFAVGFLFPATNSMSSDDHLKKLIAELPPENVWLSSWELLGSSLLSTVKRNQWKLLLPMTGLVLLSLWLAFRRLPEIFLSLGVLISSGLFFLTVMKLAGWSWNLLNLMAVPLILGTGVDYSLFMQLALRRHHGDLRVAHRSVGRALLLCGGTAVAGFGSLGLSSNAGMASLGQVCAAGIAANTLISVFLLPVWWQKFAARSLVLSDPLRLSPSSLYGAKLWQLGHSIARCLPTRVCELLARSAAAIYWLLAPHRREVVVQNLLPVLNGDRAVAERTARRLFTGFAIKVAHLLHFESGTAVDRWMGEWSGWERFQQAHERRRGVLLVTPHLGNWEIGGPFVVKKGCRLLVLTQAEPDERLTELRQSSRAQWGVETLVVGDDPFAFIKIIKRLNEGATVALLVDRPPATTAVTVKLFGKPFQASIAAAELARASGCAIMPVYVVLKDGSYAAQILPEILYERAEIGDREARIRLTGEILRVFEPVILQHVEQWYHFVPVWPSEGLQREPQLK